MIRIDDITQRLSLEEMMVQSEKMLSVGGLAAGMAHEINNPLAWVLGNLDLLVEGLRGEHRDVARRAAEGARRVDRIVRDLKTFSRTRPPEPAAVVLPTAVSSAVNMIRHQVRDRGVLIEDYAPVPTVDGDETRVGQVCLNLLVNALEALPADRREENRIEVKNRRHGQPGSLARGFFVWNSEVGSQSIGAAFFLFDYVCMNRIVWGVQDFKEIRLRHTKSAPNRWLEEISPVLMEYSNASAAPIEQTIREAQRKRVDDDLDAFLRNRFTTAAVEQEAMTTSERSDQGRGSKGGSTPSGATETRSGSIGMLRIR